jgi:uncharacterized protein YecE (DUF72 family)
VRTIRAHGAFVLALQLAASSERFDYDYSEDELEGLAKDIKWITPKAQSVHVLFNNNYQDQSQRGARLLAPMLAQV